jgi:ferric-dicitrate binding protein FerR (iron transport regulator)
VSKGTKAAKRRRPPSSSRRPPRGAAASTLSVRRRGARPVVRHLTVAGLAAALVWLFWSTRPTWDGEMRLWKAVGDAAFVLLLVTLSLGPLARLARP